MSKKIVVDRNFINEFKQATLKHLGLLGDFEEITREINNQSIRIIARQYFLGFVEILELEQIIFEDPEIGVQFSIELSMLHIESNRGSLSEITKKRFDFFLTTHTKETNILLNFQKNIDNSAH